jgi:hypothetical protein
LELCISLTKPNWLTTLLAMLKPSRSSTNLSTTVLTESASIMSYEAMKSPCQSLWNADGLDSHSEKFRKTELGAWPTGDRKPPPRGNTRRRDAHLGCPKTPRRPEALPRCSFFCLRVSFATERAATGGASAAATENSTTVKHHHPIPRRHSRTVSSSTSRTTPYDRLTSGRARRACASTAAAIGVAKLSSRVAVLLGALTAFLLRCSRFVSVCWCSRGRPFGGRAAASSPEPASTRSWPPLPLPPPLATVIVSISYTNRCARLW